jgi:AraC-like DNA-binding protein
MTFNDDAPGRSAPAPAVSPVLVDEARQDLMRHSLELDFVDRSKSGKQFSVVARSFGSVQVASVDGAASSLIRSRRHLADGKDLISIVISRGGRFSVEGVEGPDHYAAYGAAVLESRREGGLHALDDGAAWTVSLERAPLEPMLANVRLPLQRCVQGDNPALHLLNSYLGTLFTLQQPCDPVLASQHIRDLTLSALGMTGDAQALVRERGVREARLHTVLDLLAQASAEPGLDPSQFAARLNMSARYLHRLLEPSGQTFSGHLLRCRLERAATMLRDPELAHLRIGEIAARAGFADISHFNRSFRQAFSDTPKGLRAWAARQSANKPNPMWTTR